MSVLQYRRKKKNKEGKYDVVHYETDSTIVLRPNGETVETTLARCITCEDASDTVPPFKIDADYLNGKTSEEIIEEAVGSVKPYTHPQQKQCNYVYTHPQEKQCSYSVNIVNNLESNDANSALSAAQGKALKEYIDKTVLNSSSMPYVNRLHNNYIPGFDHLSALSSVIYNNKLYIIGKTGTSRDSATYRKIIYDLSTSEIQYDLNYKSAPSFGGNLPISVSILSHEHLMFFLSPIAEGSTCGLFCYDARNDSTTTLATYNSDYDSGGLYDRGILKDANTSNKSEIVIAVYGHHQMQSKVEVLVYTINVNTASITKTETYTQFGSGGSEYFDVHYIFTYGTNILITWGTRNDEYYGYIFNRGIDNDISRYNNPINPIAILVDKMYGYDGNLRINSIGEMNANNSVKCIYYPGYNRYGTDTAAPSGQIATYYMNDKLNILTIIAAEILCLIEINGDRATYYNMGSFGLPKDAVYSYTYSQPDNVLYRVSISNLSNVLIEKVEISKK